MEKPQNFMMDVTVTEPKIVSMIMMETPNHTADDEYLQVRCRVKRASSWLRMKTEGISDGAEEKESNRKNNNSN